MPNPNPSTFVLKTLRRYISARPTSIQSQKHFESRLKRLLVYLSFGSLGTVVYHNFVNTDLEVIYTPTDLNLDIVNSLRDVKRMKYKSCPMLFHRSLEILYGNVYDHRDYCDYTREIIHTKDSENLAIGGLTRLGVDTRQAR